MNAEIASAMKSCFGHFSGCVPGAGFALGKTAQIHGVADQFDPVQGGKDQRDDDHQGVLEAVFKLSPCATDPSPRACCARLISW